MHSFRLHWGVYALLWLLLALCSGVTQIYWHFRPSLDFQVLRIEGVPYTLEIHSNLPEQSRLDIRAWTEDDFLAAQRVELHDGVGSLEIPVDWFLDDREIFLSVLFDPMSNPMIVQKKVGTTGQSLSGEHVFEQAGRNLLYYRLKIANISKHRAQARMLLDAGYFELSRRLWSIALEAKTTRLQDYFLFGWSVLRQGTWDDDSHKLALNAYKASIAGYTPYVWRPEAEDIVRSLEHDEELRDEAIDRMEELKRPRNMVTLSGSKEFELGMSYRQMMRLYKLVRNSKKSTRKRVVFDIPEKRVCLWFNLKRVLVRIQFYGEEYSLEPGIHRGLLVPEVEGLVKEKLRLMLAVHPKKTEHGMVHSGYAMYRGVRLLVERTQKKAGVIPVDRIVGIEVNALRKKSDGE